MASTRDPAVRRRVRAAGVAALIGAVVGPAVVGGAAGASAPPVGCAGLTSAQAGRALQTAIAAVAAPGGTVTLAAGCTYAVAASGVGDGQGPDAFAVVGPGVTLAVVGTGGDTIEPTEGTAVRFFEVAPGGSLTLQDLTLSGGDDASGHGGGAVLNAGSLTANTVTFANDTTVGNGGAIDSGDGSRAGAAVQITDSTFDGDAATGTDNQAALADYKSFIGGNGGAVDVADDGGTGSLAVSGSRFVDDRVGSKGNVGDGGAIDVGDGGDATTGTPSAGILSVTGSTFTGDQVVTGAQGDGGAIDAGDNGGTVTGPAKGPVTIDASTFTQDSTSGNGGALDAGDATPSVAVTASTFESDSAATVAGADFSGDGGAVDVADAAGQGTLTVADSTFATNRADADGGAVDVGDNGGGPGTLTVTDSTFSANHAGYVGGAAFVGDAGVLPAVRPAGKPLVGASAIVASTFDGDTVGVPTGGVLAFDPPAILAADLLASPGQQLCATGPSSDGGDYTTPADAGYDLFTDASCVPAPHGTPTFATGSAELTGLAGDLGPLADNGGPTPTLALAPAPDPAAGAIPDPTVDPPTVGGFPNPAAAGYPDLCPRTDQTGYASAAGSACAVGAYEPRSAPTVTVIPHAPTVDVTLGVSPPTVADGGEAGVVFTVTATGSAGAPTGTVGLSTGTTGAPGTTGTTGGTGTTGATGTTMAAARTTGAVPLCTVTLVPVSGKAGTSAGSCSPPTGSVLPPGTYPVTGAYAGDATYPATATNAVTLVVTAPPTAPSSGTSACSLQGYRLAGSLGQVYAFGPARFGGALPSGPGGLGIDPNGHIVGIAATPDCRGYWLAGSDGGVFTFGDATFDESLPKGPGGLDVVPASPIAGIVSTGDGLGYWLVGSDGGVFAFGDAPFDTSLPSGPGGLGVTPSAPIVGIAGTPDRRGYWLVGRDGSVYALGDAPFLGGANTLDHGGGPGEPVVGIAATPDGGGYWLVARGGAVYAFGDAAYLGGATAPASPVVGILATPDGGGYWLAEADGAVLPYGDAQDLGDLSGSGAAGAAIVGIGH